MNARILALIALRSLLAHKVKSGIVGAILFFGTFLVVVGSSLLDSVERSMEKSITSSLAGHLQVYSADAEDELALFGGMGFGSTDIGEIPDFSKVEAELVKVEGVKAVVPMGITTATVFGSNEIDDALGALRDAVDAGDAARVAALAGHVREIATAIRKDQVHTAAIAADRAKSAEDLADLDRVTSDAFWAEFAARPLPALDFLDSRIAPMAADGRMLYLRAIGTDLERFAQTFDRFYVVDGEPVPPGKRGFLFSKRTYEKLVKNKVARELDDVWQKVRDGATIAEDTLLQEQIARMAKQYARIQFQLDPQESAGVSAALAKAGIPGDDLAAQLQAFLTLDDASIEARHAFFYAEIAPRIRLYEIPVGGTITLRSYTKSGYVKSLNVKVYGTYEFRGLEKSDLASASNLVDLMTWRELYGRMSDEQKAELAGIKQAVGVAEVSREDAEAALFGGDAPVETTAAAGATGFDEFDGVDLAGKRDRADALVNATFSREELERGLALNAAVVLDDPEGIARMRPKVAAAAETVGLKVVDWQEATGIIGQFITVMRGVLLVAIFVTFLVALVIINNSMVMATLERTGEIGTMRAIGAQRGFVTWLVLIETVLLGLASGGSGAAAGAALVTWLGSVGVPAPQDIFVLLFAGPRLYPSVGAGNVLFGLGTILGVSVLATLYPARLAASVPPVVAMQGKEA
ncbi:MAG: FtsX-like permease family protein [Myxococcota bacterium]